LQQLKKSLMHDLLTGKIRVDFSHLLNDCAGET